MKKYIGHQGDVIFYQVDKLPKGAKTIKSAKSFVVRHGESGHKHQLVTDEDITLKQVEDMFYYIVNSPAKITHEEHKTLPLQPGIYTIGDELEDDPRSDLIRPVVD